MVGKICLANAATEDDAGRRPSGDNMAASSSENQYIQVLIRTPGRSEVPSNKSCNLKHSLLKSKINVD